MEIWQAIVLGFVQGFAEFLPISSSGHLILLSNWFGIEDNVIFYSVMLHLGPLQPNTRFGRDWCVSAPYVRIRRCGIPR